MAAAAIRAFGQTPAEHSSADRSAGHTSSSAGLPAGHAAAGEKLAGTKNAKAAGTFLDTLLNDTNVTAMTKANGAVPATNTVLAKSELYKQGGPLQLFADQLAKTCGDSDITKSCVAVTRPVTGGYPVVTAKFSEALNSIYGGADPKSTLSKAARAIDQDFSDNAGYKIP